MNSKPQMAYHEYANLFPMLGYRELQDLSSDIQKNGLQVPITLYEGKVLDGRNRYQACLMAEVELITENYTGEDALAYVISHNLRRRHLTESQRAMVASKVATMRLGENQYKEGPSIGGPKGLSTKDRATAAAELNVGTSSLDRARKVQRDGSESLIKAVESGSASVSAAYKISNLPKEEQDDVVNQGAEAVKAKASELRKKPATEPMVHTPPPASSRAPKYVHDDAKRLWLLARVHLDKILKEDASREAVFNEVIKYATNKLNEQ